MKKVAIIYMIILLLILLLIHFKGNQSIITHHKQTQNDDKPELYRKYPIHHNAIEINDMNIIPSSELKAKLESGWNLVWNDEFNREVINNNFWILQNGGGIWGNNELQYYTDRSDNCYIEDGKLIIRALKENYQNHQYTSARLTTKEKIDFLYGKIEIKAKLPAGKGLFPAFWLLPCEDSYGDRKKNGEIDLVEMLGNDPRFIYGVAHYSLNNKYRSYKKYSNKKDFSKELHIYSIEWSEKNLVWLIDDIVYFSFDFKKIFTNNYIPFNKKFYLIINLAVGGNWPGFDLTNTTFPSKIEIDYVRYYKKVN